MRSLARLTLYSDAGSPKDALGLMCSSDSLMGKYVVARCPTTLATGLHQLFGMMDLTVFQETEPHLVEIIWCSEKYKVACNCLDKGVS